MKQKTNNRSAKKRGAPSAHGQQEALAGELTLCAFAAPSPAVLDGQHRIHALLQMQSIEVGIDAHLLTEPIKLCPTRADRLHPKK